MTWLQFVKFLIRCQFKDNEPSIRELKEKIAETHIENMEKAQYKVICLCERELKNYHRKVFAKETTKDYFQFSCSSVTSNYLSIRQISNLIKGYFRTKGFYTFRESGTCRMSIYIHPSEDIPKRWFEDEPE